MACSFTLQHYREILENALKSGYEFRGFHQSFSPQKRTLYLRHDLDICLEEALEMATLEAELGIRATYFVLINSPIYNLLADDSLELLHYIIKKGHWIGLHVDPALLPTDDADKMERYISKLIEFYGDIIPLVPVVSFHRPTPNVLGRDFDSFISTYSSPFFKKIKYISDSNGVWREGCPCQVLRQGTYPALQILVHPIWWRSSEKEGINDRLHYLLNKRFERFKKYLGANIEPIGKLFKMEGGK